MARINMIVADPDLVYLKAIENYFTEHCSQRFHVYLYSKAEALEKRLLINEGETDILLLHPRLLTEEIAKVYGGKVLILSEGAQPQGLEEYPAIYKYQRGDMLTAEILRNLQGIRANVLPLDKDSKQTKIGLFYSPEGGSGKTTLAMAMGTLLAGIGKEVLYLTFESFPSTSLYFQWEGAEQFSQLYYYMKGENKQLMMRLEGIRLKDPITQINYFPPAEEPAEFYEVTPEELVSFMDQLKKSGLYDYILVDVSSSYDERIHALVELCQQIMIVVSQSPVSMIKKKALLKVLNSNGENRAIENKIIICLNQIGGCENAMELEDEKFILPYAPDLLVRRGKRYQINLDSSYIKSLSGLMESFINGD